MRATHPPAVTVIILKHSVFQKSTQLSHTLNVLKALMVNIQTHNNNINRTSSCDL